MRIMQQLRSASTLCKHTLWKPLLDPESVTGLGVVVALMAGLWSVVRPLVRCMGPGLRQLAGDLGPDLGPSLRQLAGNLGPSLGLRLKTGNLRLVAHVPNARLKAMIGIYASIHWFLIYFNILQMRS